MINDSSDLTGTALRYCHELVLPGFGYPVAPYGGLSFYSFSPDTCLSQFEGFAERVISATGRSYLPIYRMADGEFEFLVGWRPPVSTTQASNLVQRVRRRLSLVRRRLDPKVRATMWGEGYTRERRKAALGRLEDSLHHVSKSGSLALYFMNRPDHWGEQYIDPVLEWFTAHHISLAENNVTPFYFVYGLLNGPTRRELYAGRHLLVVTHLSAERVEAIEAGLKQEGARSVQFLPISARHSMLDTVDLGTLRASVDLALIAAGIGSVNVLSQLEPLSIPCIDCGICLECFINPARRKERPFLLDDERMRDLCVQYDDLRFLPSLRVTR